MPAVTADPSLNSESIPLTAPNGPEPSLVAVRKRRSNRVTWTGVLTTLLVFILAAGPATALVVWIVVRRFRIDQEFQTPSFDTLRKGTFTLDEGSKLANDGTTQTTAALGALTISSFANQLVAIANSFAMGLVAYRIAGQWISLSEAEEGVQKGNPTPSQYGLLMGLLGAQSYSALARASTYSVRRSRAQLPRMFIEALSFSILLYLLTHAIGLTDLWLHTTARSILVPVQSSLPVQDASRAGVAFDDTLCSPEGFFGWEMSPCAPTVVRMGQANATTDEVKDRGLLASYNLTEAPFRVITLAESDNTAIVLPSILPSANLLSFSASGGLAFATPTLGAQSNCTLLNLLCFTQKRYLPVQDCSGAVYSYLPIINSTAGQLYLPSAVFSHVNGSIGNLTYLSAGGEVEDFLYQSFPIGTAFTNPVEIGIQLHMPLTAMQSKAVNPTQFTEANNMFWAVCSLEFLEVLAAYNPLSDSWSIANSTPASTSLTSALAGPIVSGNPTPRLIANIQGTMYQGNPGSMKAMLEQELARQAVAWPSGAYKLADATEVSWVVLPALGSYPMAPVIVLISLLYTYALLALWIYFTSSTFPSYDIKISGSDSADQTAIELSQKWLTHPLALVGFALAQGDEKDAGRSVAKKSVDMARDAGEDRLWIGIHPNGNGETVFGVQKQTTLAKEV